MAKIGFFVSEFPFSIEKYIIDEIDTLNSIGIQPFILSDRKFPVKKYSHIEIEPSLSVWQSLKSLNGLVEESDFLKALKRSSRIFEDESTFAMATKASMIIKSKKIEILNAYSSKTYNIAMVSSWITRVPFGISIFTPDHFKNVPEIETILKEASFIVVYSDKIFKDLKRIGFFDTDKVLRVFPGLNPPEFTSKRDGKICLVEDKNNIIDKVLKIFPPEKIILVKGEKVFNMKGEVENVENTDLSKLIENFELILYSSFPSFDNMFSFSNRLLRKALYYGVPILIFGNLKGDENNIEKLLKNFLKPEEQLESVLQRITNDEKFRKKLVSEGKEIASALFDLQCNANLLKGLFERVLVENYQTNSMDRWLKRGRKLPRKD